MKYFAKCNGGKTRVSTVRADISQGCSAPNRRKKNSAAELVNFLSDEYPWLNSRDRFFYKAYNKVFIDGVGIYDDNIYYIYAGYFYYNNIKYFPVSVGRKSFLHYNGKIIILPDMLCFEPETKKHAPLGVSTGKISYEITNRTVGEADWGLSCIRSEDAELTELFKVGDSIKLTDERGLIISGFHTVTGIDDEHGKLFFHENEFGSGEPVILTGSISNGAPESCDAACISGGRIWIAGGNRLWASAVNNECNWAVDDGDDTSAFACDILGEGRITACIESEGSPVFFSGNKIYKIYGDGASGFHLRVCSDWGGVPGGMSNTIAAVRDKIFYVSSYGVTFFDGINLNVLRNTPFDFHDARNVGASDGDRYYVCVGENSTSNLYAYDVVKGQWYSFGSYPFISFFTYKNALCASDGTGITVLCGHFDMMDEQQYQKEAVKHSIASFEIDTEGAKPIKICIECETGSDADYNFYIRQKSSYIKLQLQCPEIHVGAVSSHFTGKIELVLIPKKCESISVNVRGTGKMLIKDISAELVP